MHGRTPSDISLEFIGVQSRLYNMSAVMQHVQRMLHSPATAHPPAYVLFDANAVLYSAHSCARAILALIMDMRRRTLA